MWGDATCVMETTAGCCTTSLLVLEHAPPYAFGILWIPFLPQDVSVVSRGQPLSPTVPACCYVIGDRTSPSALRRLTPNICYSCLHTLNDGGQVLPTNAVSIGTRTRRLTLEMATGPPTNALRRGRKICAARFVPQYGQLLVKSFSFENVPPLRASSPRRNVVRCGD